MIDRSQCTCYQPTADPKYYKVDTEQLPKVIPTYKDEIEASGLYIDTMIQWATIEAENSQTCSEKYTLLTQEDFLYGTYRITECGNYVLDEDIVINFNGPSETFSYEAGDSPNAYAMDDLPWYPTTEQQESGQYFGLNAFWGPFSIGFFAGISVETDHVYIDLNGHSIEMDPEFYLQQRFFAIVELGNKQFEARQGPVDFGREDIHIHDIIIKDGTLGRTSHHGIHGAFARSVSISGLNIKDFDVGGIQLST